MRFLFRCINSHLPSYAPTPSLLDSGSALASSFATHTHRLAHLPERSRPELDVRDVVLQVGILAGGCKV